MIPYLGVGSFPFLGLTVQVWGLFIALAFAVGTAVAYRRARREGLDTEQLLAIVGWIFVAAMVGARIFHVLVYEPGYYLEHPWKAIDPREPGYAIMGGFLGAAGVFFWYVQRYALNWIAYADTLVWGLPWGCGVGRIGCFLIHDHPGTLTNSPLGVRYPDGQVRHDLGLYLSLIGFGMGVAFLFLGRKARPAGYWFALFLVLEGLTRVLLDPLRLADVRYVGLTPAQMLGALFFVGGGYWLWRLYRAPEQMKETS